jgi:hypothetical protein
MAKKYGKRGAAVVVLMIAGAIAAGPGTATASAALGRQPVAPPAAAPVVVTVQAPATPAATTVVPVLTIKLGLDASWAEASWAET